MGLNDNFTKRYLFRLSTYVHFWNLYCNNAGSSGGAVSKFMREMLP